MNFAEMQQEVIDIRFSENDRARVKNWINKRYAEVWGAADWSFKHTIPAAFTITGADNTPTMPTNFGKINQVFDDQGNELIYRAPWEFEVISQNVAYAGRVGRPQGYTLINDQIILTPTPDTGYTFKVSYEKRVACLVGGSESTGLMSNDTDEPIWPVEYHYLLVVGAIATGMKLVNDPNATQVEQEFSQAYSIMEDDLSGVQPAFNLQYGRDSLGDEFWG